MFRNMTTETTDRIRRKLTDSLAPLHLEINDESHLHLGHAAARPGTGHYAVTIVSEAFEAHGALERHRLVYRVLSAEMESLIHALALSAYTPAEWARRGKTAARPSTRG